MATSNRINGELAAREIWLTKLANAYRPHLKELAGLDLPEQIRIGVGDMGAKTRGRAHGATMSGDGTIEITVSLRQSETQGVAGTIAHEMIHAAGIWNHRKEFSQAGAKLGLSGKPTSMAFHDGVPEWAKPILAELGDYPASGITGTAKPKEPTRMIKCECDDCGIVFRTTRKHIAAIFDTADYVQCPDPTCGGTCTVEI